MSYLRPRLRKLLGSSDLAQLAWRDPPHKAAYRGCQTVHYGWPDFVQTHRVNLRRFAQASVMYIMRPMAHLSCLLLNLASVAMFRVTPPPLARPRRPPQLPPHLHTSHQRGLPLHGASENVHSCSFSPSAPGFPSPVRRRLSAASSLPTTSVPRTQPADSPRALVSLLSTFFRTSQNKPELVENLA